MNKTTVSDNIISIVKTWEQKLVQLKADELSHKKNGQNRSIKQIIGHLIDSASNNHQRMVRLQYNQKLDFPDYRQDNDRWIALQKYQDENWENLVQLWVFFNLHIAWIINQTDENHMSGFWTDCDRTEVSLAQMIDGYYAHLLLHLNEIDDLMTK